MKVYCKYDKLVSLDNLKEHPQNRNRHDEDQIDRIAKLYEYHGIRHPILVSKRSGYIVAGHGRKLAAVKAGYKEFPVVYQDFESDEKEYTFVQADNAIALWAYLDVTQISEDLKAKGDEFLQGFDFDVIGLKNFTLESLDNFKPEDHWNGMPEYKSEDVSANRTILVHFYNDEDVQKFAQLVGQQITDKTKYIYYPEVQRDVLKDKGYGSIEEEDEQE
jgi:hypothetical protein